MENTGPSAAPVAIARKSGDLISEALSRVTFDLVNQSFVLSIVQTCGNI